MEDTIPGPAGPVRIRHYPGTFAPSPATRLMVRAIGAGHGLAGLGVDWGCGTGALAIAAARLPAVRRVIGLDLSAADIEAARRNAKVNGVAERTEFHTADGYQPFTPAGRRAIDAARGSAGFVVANPPASEGDDGFSFRRVVLEGAAELLAPGGVVLMQILSAYGPDRVRRLVESTPGFLHDGVVESTAAVPFDLRRDRLGRQLDDYVAEEARGGLPYHFESEAGTLTATEADARHRAGGALPLARWQAHRFVRV